MQVLDAVRAEERVTVEAIQGGVPIYSISSDAKRTQVGTVQYRDYDDRRLRVPVMYPEGSADKPHSLGHASGRFELVDHYTVLEPLLAMGFVPRLLKHFRGNAEMVAVMANPDITVPDTLNWDQGLYPNGNAKGKLEYAVRVWSNLHVGSGIRATVGFLRVVCQNGLVAVALGMGHRMMSHGNFNQETFRNWVVVKNDEAKGLDSGSQYTALPGKVLAWPLRALDAVIADPMAVERYPKFAAEPLKQLSNRLPAWGMPALRDQLELAQAADQVAPVDLLNILTNAANLDPRADDGRSWQMYRRMDPLFHSLYDLVEIGAFEVGSSGFGLKMPAAAEEAELN